MVLPKQHNFQIKAKEVLADFVNVKYSDFSTYSIQNWNNTTNVPRDWLGFWKATKRHNVWLKLQITEKTKLVIFYMSKSLWIWDWHFLLFTFMFARNNFSTSIICMLREYYPVATLPLIQ